eukprot:scaffold5373_cov103-Isochrysis_galbana.AAC.6
MSFLSWSRFWDPFGVSLADAFGLSYGHTSQVTGTGTSKFNQYLCKGLQASKVKSGKCRAATSSRAGRSSAVAAAQPAAASAWAAHRLYPAVRSRTFAPAQPIR